MIVYLRMKMCICFVIQSVQEEPIHILNVAIKTDSDTDDDGLAASFREFTQSKVGSGQQQGFYFSSFQQRVKCLEMAQTDIVILTFLPFSHSRNLCCLNMESVG